MAITVDARGLACPQPVIQTRRALKSGEDVVTIVDNDTSRHNVTRMAEKQGCTVHTEVREDGIYLHIHQAALPSQTVTSPAPVEAPSVQGPTVLLVPSETMGRGEHEELGSILVRGFFHTLGELDKRPDTLIFLNSGVKLVVEGSPVLEDLQTLQNEGVEILACGTCLGYYELKEKLAVGEVSNMYTIAETLLGAGRLITL